MFSQEFSDKELAERNETFELARQVIDSIRLGEITLESCHILDNALFLLMQDGRFFVIHIGEKKLGLSGTPDLANVTWGYTVKSLPNIVIPGLKTILSRKQ